MIPAPTLTAHQEVRAVADLILSCLEEAQGEPLPRCVLVEEVRRAFPRWSLETCRRAFRRGRRLLLDEGYPMVSDGERGFVLDASGHAYEEDLRRRERTLRSEAITLARLRGMRPREYAQQLLCGLGEATP